MDDILEMILTFILEMLSLGDYKRRKTRTWLLTVFFLLLALTLSGFCVWHMISFWYRGNTAGAIAFGILSAAMIVISTAVVARGHKKNWERY